jgi:hypothetical protein
MHDFRYRQTAVTLDVHGFAFRAAGRRPIDLGWRAVFPSRQPADEKGDELDAPYPMVSGGWMLSETNDGFAGIDAVDAYRLTELLVMEVYPLEAGTEKITPRRGGLR